MPSSEVDRVVVGIRRLEPGTRLPSIRELAEQFQVGETTVKTALRDLRVQGVTRSIPGKGVWIRSPGDLPG